VLRLIAVRPCRWIESHWSRQHRNLSLAVSAQREVSRKEPRSRAVLWCARAYSGLSGLLGDENHLTVLRIG
jgi:hypothetical protein